MITEEVEVERRLEQLRTACRKAGVKLTHIPYKGPGPALAAGVTPVFAARTTRLGGTS